MWKKRWQRTGLHAFAYSHKKSYSDLVAYLLITLHLNTTRYSFFKQLIRRQTKAHFSGSSLHCFLSRDWRKLFIERSIACVNLGFSLERIMLAANLYFVGCKRPLYSRQPAMLLTKVSISVIRIDTMVAHL
jgi:hypothetical protein